MKIHRKGFLWAGAAVAALLLTCLALSRWTEQPIPGLIGKERTLLRIWVVNAPGGGQAWLRQQLGAFEKAYPGVGTWVRTVTPEELSEPDAVLPDVILYMPGDVTEPQKLFLPLSGETVARDGLLREELLRCGRWQGQQYGLPLCWGGWVLAIDGALEPESASTPAPTTLLGRPAATASAQATTEPGYPLAAVVQAACALQSPGGCALFAARLLLEETPPLPEGFATLSAQEVYAAYRNRQCATAMLTTGQMAAFAAMCSSGSGFPYRVMTPEEVITDQVWLGSVTPEASPQAALLLAFLTSPEAQRALTAQELHTARRDLLLYADGLPGRMEQAGQNNLAAVNAYLSREDVQSAAWQYFQGDLTLDEALLPLM